VDQAEVVFKYPLFEYRIIRRVRRSVGLGSRWMKICASRVSIVDASRVCRSNR